MSTKTIRRTSAHRARGAGSGTRSRREREKAARRRAMLEAAERVFAARGFEGATVEDIAREAEFSVGALYLFFRNKQVLWTEVIAKIGRDGLEAFDRETAAAADPLEAILTLIDLRLRHAQEHGAFLRVFMDAVPGSQVDLAATIPPNCHALYDEYIDKAAALFKAAMARGLLRKADATYTALSLDGAIQAFRAFWRRRGVALPVPEQARVVRRHFLDPLRMRKATE